LAPIAWLVFGAWMLSLEYFDYPLGNHGLTFGEARALIRRRPGAALGFGGVIMALTAIPVVNLVAMPAAVAGAAALYVEVFADSVDEAASRTASS
jgi:CysZ protein